MGNMRYMMRGDYERRNGNDRDRYEYSGNSGGGYGGNRGSGGSRMHMDDGERYEARRLPPRNRYGEFRRRRYEYGDHQDMYGYEGDEYDSMGRRRFREDDWQTQGYVSPERERRYYEQESDRDSRRERRRREMMDWDDDDGYD